MGSALTKDEGHDAESEQLVRQMVADFPVMVFSKTYCQYCVRAKKDLDSVLVSGFAGAEILELDRRSDGKSIQRALNGITGRRTVPNIFIGGKPVGGSEELHAIWREGTLDTLVSDALQRQTTKSRA